MLDGVYMLLYLISDITLMSSLKKYQSNLVGP